MNFHKGGAPSRKRFLHFGRVPGSPDELIGNSSSIALKMLLPVEGCGGVSPAIKADHRAVAAN
jgi:hypothetical protein